MVKTERKTNWNTKDYEREIHAVFKQWRANSRRPVSKINGTRWRVAKYFWRGFRWFKVIVGKPFRKP